MTWNDIVSFSILSYYDSKLKAWIKALKASASQDGLMSKEDFSKLSGIEAGAEENVIETVKVNGTALTPDEYKAVNIDISGKAEKSEMSVEAGTGADADKTTITLKSGTSATVLTSHQDISGKANKSEMSVVAGEGANADKTTITHKEGTSATVLTTHQDISGKVDKETGKGLSTNDYTDAEKSKLNGIEAGAQVNIIEEVQLGGSALTVTNKSVNITTDLSQFNNGTSDFQSGSQVDAKISQALTSAVIYKGSVATVADLPTTGNRNGDMYDVQADDINRIWNGTSWDQYSPTIIINTATEAQIDSLFPAA